MPLMLPAEPREETAGEGSWAMEQRAEKEGGTGEEAREVGRELAGDKVDVVRVRSGLETELIQHRLDSLDSFRMGRLLELNRSRLRSAKVGRVREGREVELEEREEVYGYTKVQGRYWTAPFLLLTYIGVPRAGRPPEGALQANPVLQVQQQTVTTWGT